MATHDDKISNKRRRLFKALSAAPVVVTLRPGEALANGSAFYCAAKIRSFAIDDWIPEAGVPGDCSATAAGDLCTIDGVIYKKLNYWEKSEVTRHSLASADCKSVWDLLPDTIVGMPDGSYRNLDDGAPVVASILEQGTDAAGRSLLKVFSGSKECFFLTARHGLSSYVGHTTNNDMGWQEDGFFPQHEISGADAPGELQGMTESCMDSFTTAKIAHLTTG